MTSCLLLLKTLYLCTDVYFKAPITTAADDCLEKFFIVFQRKRLNILCVSSAQGWLAEDSAEDSYGTSSIKI